MTWKETPAGWLADAPGWTLYARPVQVGGLGFGAWSWELSHRSFWLYVGGWALSLAEAQALAEDALARMENE